MIYLLKYLTNNSLRMVADIEHFQATLGKIEGSANLGKSLLDIVQAKTTAAPTVTPAAAPSPDNAESEGQQNEAATPES